VPVALKQLCGSILEFTAMRSKKNVDGRSTNSHDNKKLRARSMEKQRGMAIDR